MGIWQERAVQEKADMDDKLKKLNRFLSTQMFQKLDQDEQKRLELQAYLMTELVKVLADRIAHFPKA